MTQTTIQTPEPKLYEDWLDAAGVRNVSEADFNAYVEKQRPSLANLRDPLSPLFAIACDARLALKERVIWEDSVAMALVDFGDDGSTLLVVPKKTVNFLVDLNTAERAHLAKVAAATCDALIVAAGQAIATPAACHMFVNPPGGLELKQLHVHVVANTRVTRPVDDEYHHRTAKHLRSLLGGSGCF